MSAKAGTAHSKFTSLRACAAAASITLGVLSPCSLSQRYSLTVLPLPEGHFGAQSYSINIHGDICGAAFGMERPDIPVLWRDNRVIELPLLPDPRSEEGWAWGMNDHGVIVGQVDGPHPQQAVMWTDENTIVPILDRDSSAKDINNNMTVVGNYAVAFLDVHGFIWKGGDWQSLFPMRFFGQINERGQVVGFDNQRSWRWENGRFTEPVPLSPGAQAKASGINDLGVMVGWSMKSGDTAFPVIWTNDVPREMPTIRAGLAGGIARMNRVGEAIGQCLVNSNESRATLWRKNLATEIEDLIIGPGARPWRVSPRDINDVGQIAATVQFVGGPGYRMARLSPVDIGLTLIGFEPSRPGRRNVIEVNHATPGGRVSILWGTTRGDPTPLEQCPGAMIDIADPRLATTGVAGPDGRATISVFIPAHVEGTYILQAVDHDTCEVSPPAWALLKMEN